MTSLQRVPVIEEITLSDSDDKNHILEDNHLQRDKNVSKRMDESTKEIITNKFPNQNIKFTIKQVYLQGDFKVFNVPDSSDDEAMKISNVNSISNATKDDIIMGHNDTNVNSTSNVIKYDTNLDHEGYNDGAETDEDQFYIDEDVKNTDTDSDEPMDLRLLKEDEMLSSISSSYMSPNSKSDDDKLSTVSSGVETSKESNIQTDEEKINNVFKEDVKIDNATSDDELDSAEGENQEISMPSRNDKQFRVRGKLHVETICETCHIERRIQGKIWQNKICRYCKEDLLFQCTNCKKRFSSYHSTLCHLKKECLSQNVWSCSLCPYSVLEEKKLEEHMKKRHVDGKKARRKAVSKVQFFTCDKCDAGFRWKGNFQKHKCGKQRVYQCQMCDFTSYVKNVVKRHFNNSHVNGSSSSSKRFAKFISNINSRPICVPDITSSSNISNESKRKTEEETRVEQKRLNKSISLRCPKCFKNFEYNGTHIKKCEICEGPLIWQCILCDERSKSYCGIYEHLQNSCIAIMKSCRKCSKRFVSDDDLEKHQHICGKDLYLQCELCDFKTKVKGFFRKHVKDKHNLQDDKIHK